MSSFSFSYFVTLFLYAFFHSALLFVFYMMSDGIYSKNILSNCICVKTSLLMFLLK